MKKKRKICISVLLLLLASFYLPVSAAGLYSKKAEKTEMKTDENLGLYKPILRSDGDGNLNGDPNNDGMALGDKEEMAPIHNPSLFLLVAGLVYGMFVRRRDRKRKNCSTA
jgi:hypothetical protein